MLCVTAECYVKCDCHVSSSMQPPCDWVYATVIHLDEWPLHLTVIAVGVMALFTHCLCAKNLPTSDSISGSLPLVEYLIKQYLIQSSTIQTLTKGGIENQPTWLNVFVCSHKNKQKSKSWISKGFPFLLTLHVQTIPFKFSCSWFLYLYINTQNAILYHKNCATNTQIKIWLYCVRIVIPQSVNPVPTMIMTNMK